MTFFWSQADFLSERRPVTLARRRGLACQSCQRRDRCGGYFAAYLDRHGEGELEPYQR
jgi:MoaA/NifB/PqqE/SkfB family radical SAM enzyme